MKWMIMGLLGLCLIASKSDASPQISKLVPVEDWVAFKRQTSDVNPLDKILGKLRATYDFVFQKPENVSNIGKILTKETFKKEDEEPYKFILSSSSIPENSKDEEENTVLVEFLDDKMVLPTRESSISKISKGNSIDEVEVELPDKLEIVDEDADEGSDVENGRSTSTFELPAAFARAFIKWLTSILGISQGLYLKFTNTTAI